MRPPARNGLAMFLICFSLSAFAAPLLVVADENPDAEASSTEPASPSEDVGSSEETPSEETLESTSTEATSSAKDIATVTATPAKETTASSGTTFTISDGITGGDCILIGIWLPDARTCMLAHDIQGQIVIATSSVTLDGGSFTLHADPSRGAYPLVSVTGQERVTIRYLAIDGADTGILFDNAVIGHANGITFTHTRIGVEVKGNNGTYVENSSDTGTDSHGDTVGVRVVDSSGTHVTSNRFTRLGTAVSVSGAFEYTLQQNIVSDSGIGFDIASSTSASVWQNFFYRDGIPARATDDSTGRFFAPFPLGGNHWDIYDQPGEGCIDSDNNGFCDRAYIVNHSEQLFDNLPYATTTPDAVEATTTCAKHCVSSVLFIPGTETSRLYMRDVFGVEHELWEPSLRPDVPLLAMNPDGTSKHEVYTKDIIDTYYGNDPNRSAILGALGKGGMVYGDFEEFMNGLVATGTVASWLPYPYDWRHDIRDIVDHGTLTEQPDGTLKQMYLEDLVETLASAASTTSHKVTIVAHSNGGLIAKALIEKLVADGKSDLVDKLVMIGTPQWGTPKDIGSMLHGDGLTVMGGLVMYGGDVREAARDMPGPYDLLPSNEYFSRIQSPVASFAIVDDAAFALEVKYPAGIRSFTDLVSFVTDAFDLDADVGSASNLNTPLALRSDLVDAASSLHDDIDHWTPPPGVAVTSIVGWGQLTPSGYTYKSTPAHLECQSIFGIGCSRRNALLHAENLTEDGDGTVVSPSAAGDVGDVWYFNAKSLDTQQGVKIFHQTLTSARSVQNLVEDILNGQTVNDDYVTMTTPIASTSPLIRVSALSPVNLVATDSHDNQTGIVAVPGKPDIFFTKQEIPGSAVQTAGEEKFLYLPAGQQYSVAIKGYANGDANIRVEDLDSGGQSLRTTTLADIPVTSNTTAAFTASGAESVAPLEIDEDGDGGTDRTLTPQAGGLVSYQDEISSSPTDTEDASTTISSRGTSSRRPGSSTQYNSIPIIEVPVFSIPLIPTATSVPALVSHSAVTVAATVPSANPATETKVVPPQSVSQTASAYAALSPTTSYNPLALLYHWLYVGWLALLSFLNDIL